MSIRTFSPWVLALAVGVAFACSSGPDAETTTTKLEDQLIDAAEKTDVDAQTKAEVKTFIKDQRKKGCEMLTPSMVASTFDVPEADLKQQKIMGCIYSWEAEGQSLQASIMSIWVRETPERARKWFENATKSVTQEELKRQMDDVTAQAKEHETIKPSETKKKGTDLLGGAMKEMMPDGGYTYVDVPGIGDAARLRTHDSNLTVLVGNMIFNLAAYKGDPQPPVDTTGLMQGDMKTILANARKAEAAWMEATRDQRKDQVVKLGKVVVEAL